MEIRESQIEDVLVSTPVLMKSILNLEDEPRLLGRQIIIPSGRLDLLYAYRTKLLLIELKVVPFQQKFVKQVLGYRHDLISYQDNGKLLHGEILPYLLYPSDSDHKGIIDTQAGITRINYNPEDILQFFYNNFEPIASFTKIKPVDFGIWNLHLMHKFLYLLLETNSVNEVQKLTNGSSKSLHNKIRFAREIRLVEHAANSDVISLTEFGKQYVAYKNNQLPERLSEAQGELLRNLVIRNPYESPVILGIASIVEAVFALSKNTYPVPMRHLIEYFSYYAGKYFDWQTNKAKYSATLMYSNYATDLGLLGKTGDTVYLTPEGFRFTIQMQLHKSLKMMESLKLA